MLASLHTLIRPCSRNVTLNSISRIPFVTMATQHLNTQAQPPSELRYVDIGVNLTDDMFSGRYHGKNNHPPDLSNVLERARNAGVVAQMVTAGSIPEVKQVLKLVSEHDDLYATAGIHPTRTSQVGQGTAYLDQLRSFLDTEAITRKAAGKIVAIGECGLDYDRLHFSSVEVQKTHFTHQLQLATQYALPLFLHCRAAQRDFLDILRAEADKIAEACDNDATNADAHKRRRIGVAHCFTGTVMEMRELVSEGLFIGLTGCSFKEVEGIEVAKQVPLERLLLETDAPWCGVKPTHASAPLLERFARFNADLHSLYAPTKVKKDKWDAAKQVKDRCEPCSVGLIAAIVAEAKGIELALVVDAARQNTRFLFGI